jgi:hypothetical protein
VLAAIRDQDLDQLERVLPMGAAQEGRSEVTRALKELGAKLTSLGPLWATSLVHLAAHNGLVKVLRLLHELVGGNLETPSPDGGVLSPVFNAALRGHADAVRVLHELGAKVDTPTKDGRTPVYAAAFAGHAGVLRVLHELGAKVETRDKDGHTPIHVAAMEDHAEMVRVLHELGGKVEAQDKDGHTPIHVAALAGHVETLRVLHELGAKVESQNKLGATPVYMAVIQGHVPVLSLLAKLGANVVTSPGFGSTPLRLSVGLADLEMAKALILLGAPITIEDLRQHNNFKGDACQLRHYLQAWAADALVQHRTFHGTFLVGCCARTPTAPTTDQCLPILAGKPGLLEKIAAFAGVMVGEELRRTRAVGPAIAAVDWELHDEVQARVPGAEPG